LYKVKLISRIDLVSTGAEHRKSEVFQRSGFITFKGIRGLNVCRKSIVAVAIVAIIMGISVACGKEPVAGSDDPP